MNKIKELKLRQKELNYIKTLILENIKESSKRYEKQHIIDKTMSNVIMRKENKQELLKKIQKLKRIIN